MMKEFLLSWGMLVVSVVFNAAGVFAIKMKLNELGAIKFDSLKIVINYFLAMCKSPFVLLGLLLFFLAPFIFTVALSRMQISVAYPAQVGLNFAILVILAILFLGESLTVYKIIGIALVFLSIYFLQR